ncbi:MAG: S24 family peptidase [Gemmobacter sp.]
MADKKAFTADLLARLEARAEAAGESEAQFARRLGSSEGLFKNLRKGSLPTADRLDVLLAELGLSLTLGKPVDTGRVTNVTLRGADFADIPLHEVMLSAGGGVENSSEEIVGHLAFRRDWLKRIRVSPSSARLVRACGLSMWPTIDDRDLLLVDTSKREPPVRRRGASDQRRAPIFALIEDGEARVKRIERPETGVLMLISDNLEFAPEVRTGAQIEAIDIIGKVMWWGHTVKE